MSSESRTRGNGEVRSYARKTLFFLCRQRNPSLPIARLAGFSTMKGNPVLFSVFWYYNCWPRKRPTKTNKRKRRLNKKRKTMGNPHFSTCAPPSHARTTLASSSLQRRTLLLRVVWTTTYACVVCGTSTCVGVCAGLHLCAGTPHYFSFFFFFALLATAAAVRIMSVSHCRTSSSQALSWW